LEWKIGTLTKTLATKGCLTQSNGYACFFFHNIEEETGISRLGEAQEYLLIIPPIPIAYHLFSCATKQPRSPRKIIENAEQVFRNFDVSVLISPV